MAAALRWVPAMRRSTMGCGCVQRRDVVLVSVNHRLNAFGYLHFGISPVRHGGIECRPARSCRRCAGCAPISPRSVAILAGSRSSGNQAGIKGGGAAGDAAARGLFQRAILQRFGTYTIAPDDAERQTRAIMAALGLAPTALDALRQVPAKRLSMPSPR
jgi:para-nitrobenzyl esterase